MNDEHVEAVADENQAAWYYMKAGEYGTKTALSACAGVALQEIGVIIEGLSDDMSGLPIPLPPGW